MTDLDKLIAAVEAGEPIRIGLLPDNMPHAWQHIYSAADGSLDAALRLHDALLPGWFWGISPYGSAHVSKQAEGPSSGGCDPDNPARSWLLAILQAVKARGES